MDENGLFSSSHTAQDGTVYTIPVVKPNNLSSIIGAEGIASILTKDENQTKYYKRYQDHLNEVNASIEGIQQPSEEKEIAIEEYRMPGPWSLQEIIHQEMAGRHLEDEYTQALDESGRLSFSAMDIEQNEYTVTQDAGEWIAQYGMENIAEMLRDTALTIGTMIQLNQTGRTTLNFVKVEQEAPQISRKNTGEGIEAGTADSDQTDSLSQPNAASKIMTQNIMHI